MIKKNREILNRENAHMKTVEFFLVFFFPPFIYFVLSTSIRTQSSIAPNVNRAYLYGYSKRHFVNRAKESANRCGG